MTVLPMTCSFQAKAGRHQCRGDWAELEGLAPSPWWPEWLGGQRGLGTTGCPWPGAGSPQPRRAVQGMRSDLWSEGSTQRRRQQHWGTHGRC